MHNPYDVSEYFNLFIGSRQNIHVDNSVILHNALSDEPRPITWLLPNWLPVDKITILAGSPGVGKSTIACAIAARVSPSQAESHVSWPDSTCHYGGNVIIISTEDDYLDTILPRLKAAGADLDHVFNINSFRPWRGIHSFTFIPENITKLEREIRAIGGAALIIIDPISQIVTGDFGNNSKMRPAMEYIGRLAKKWNCAILGITHLSKASKGKDPIDRIFGTAAIGQVARSVMIAMRNESGVLDGGGTHVLVRAKGSNVNTDGGYSYRILNDNFTNDEGDVIHTSKIDWCDAVDGTAKQILLNAECTKSPEATSAIDKAINFLNDALKNGQVQTENLEEMALKAKISKSSLARARKALGVNSKKLAGNVTWCCLPPEIPK